MEPILNWLGERRTRQPVDCFQQAYIAHQGNLYAVDVGLCEVPLDAISGTHTRCQDVKRGLMPAVSGARRQIRRAKRRLAKGEPSEPIHLLKLGEGYYVDQGHVQVVAAQRLEKARVQAHVTAYHPPKESMAGLLAREQQAFQARTGLQRPILTHPESYQELVAQIEAHHTYLEQSEGSLFRYGEAVADWWQNLYVPISRGFERDGALEMIPGLTAGDLYLYLAKYMGRQARVLNVPLSQALLDLLHGAHLDWRETLSALLPPCLFTGHCPHPDK